jgi:hypothetical protein
MCGAGGPSAAGYHFVRGAAFVARVIARLPAADAYEKDR